MSYQNVLELRDCLKRALIGRKMTDECLWHWRQPGDWGKGPRARSQSRRKYTVNFLFLFLCQAGGTIICSTFIWLTITFRTFSYFNLNQMLQFADLTLIVSRWTPKFDWQACLIKPLQYHKTLPQFHQLGSNFQKLGCFVIDGCFETCLKMA